MFNEEYWQAIQKQMQEEIERSHQEQALREKEAAEEAEVDAKQRQQDPDSVEDDKSPKEKMEEYLEDKERAAMATERAAHQFLEDGETIEEYFHHKLDDTATETSMPDHPVNSGMQAEANVATVDGMILGATLAGAMAWQAVKSHFQPEPTVVEPETEIIDPVEAQNPDHMQMPEPDLLKPFPSPDLDDDVPASAKARHDWFYQGVGDFGSISMTGKSAEQEMAEAGLREYEQFKSEQNALEDAIASESDPERRQMLELRRDIEMAEYQRVMSLETARVEHALAGGNPSQMANRYEMLADDYHAQAEALNAEWAMHCVRDPENYSPRDEAMAEAVESHRAQETDAWNDFNQRAEQEGWSSERREMETEAFQEQLDQSLHLAFDHSISSPSISF